MRVAPHLGFAAALFAFLFATTVHAQYPVAGLTATGRTLTIGAGSAWKVFIPDTFVTRPGNVADVIMHLHGDPQTVWNNAKWANLNAIIITANYGAASSAYQTPFSTDTTLFQTALDQALTAVRAQSDISDNLQWDQLVLSSFSAGYGGVREILKSATYRNNIDDLVAADSLYATTAADGTPLDSQMVDYKTFALAAKNGQKTFLLSHSKVLTYTYENTIETADELMQYLGITPTAYSATGLGTLNYYRKAQAGNFRIWGANGDTADDHSAHLRYIGDFWERLPIAKLIPGDFNLDGTVNAADYVLWRKKNGGTALPNDGGITPGVTNAADYTYWRSRYGSVFVPAINTADGLGFATEIPEPQALSLVVLMALATLARQSTRRTPR
ncbi:MAG TPA: hypothetical protein VGI40_06385 [Pirellulaceae bacterium]|jgi:hypothetical protein